MSMMRLIRKMLGLSKYPAIEKFLATWPTDRLCMLQAHAEEGKLAYYSCCCLVGVLSADHALKGAGEFVGGHYYDYYARRHGTAEGSLAVAAEREFNLMGGWEFGQDRDARRRKEVLPIIRKELARREAAIKPVVTTGEEIESKADSGVAVCRK